jgi:large subunit ribosomal protein L25
MQEVTLDAQVRSEIGKSKAKSLRDSGFIPAVVYSAGKDTQSLKLSRHDFLRFIHQYHLESTVVSLKINPVRNTKASVTESKISNGVKGQKSRTIAVLVKDVQYEPVKEDIIHIDFQEISLTSKIKVNVRVMAKGEPVGVKVDGGTLNHLLWELEVECLPKKIPEDIPVDVSQLKIGDVIYVRNLSLPPDVNVINDPESIVFSVEPPIKEEEIVPAAPVEGGEPAEPEVIKEKKEVPEEGAKQEKKEEKEVKEKKQEKEEGSSKK